MARRSELDHVVQAVRPRASGEPQSSGAALATSSVRWGAGLRSVSGRMLLIQGLSIVAMVVISVAAILGNSAIGWRQS